MTSAPSLFRKEGVSENFALEFNNAGKDKLECETPSYLMSMQGFVLIRGCRCYTSMFTDLLYSWGDEKEAKLKSTCEGWLFCAGTTNQTSFVHKRNNI